MSGFHVIAKAGLKQWDPILFVLYRVIFATPILLTIAFVYEAHCDWRKFVPPSRQMWLYCIAGGFFGSFAMQVGLAMGLEQTSASMAGISSPLVPVFSTALAIGLKMEPFRWDKIGGVTLAVLGVSIVVAFPAIFGSGLKTGNSIGFLWFIGNTLSFAIFLTLMPTARKHMTSCNYTGWCFLFSLPMVALVTPGRSNPVPVSQFSAISFVAIAYASILTSAVAFMLIAWAASRAVPSVVSVYTSVQPVLSTLLGALFLSERIHWWDPIGILIIIAGVVTVVRPRGTLAEYGHLQADVSNGSMPVDEWTAPRHSVPLLPSDQLSSEVHSCDVA